MRSILPQEENPALRETAQPVALSDIGSERIRVLIYDMKRLLAKEKFGVALAAPQVGESLRLFIVSGKALARGARNAEDEEDKGDEDIPALPDQVYINPELMSVSRAKNDKHEGCLSVRGRWGIVSRSLKATVRAYDENGNRFTRGASGFLAHIFQHEMDHLQGVLYIDKAKEIYDDDKGDEA